MRSCDHSKSPCRFKCDRVIFLFRRMVSIARDKNSIAVYIYIFTHLFYHNGRTFVENH